MAKVCTEGATKDADSRRWRDHRHAMRHGFALVITAGEGATPGGARRVDGAASPQSVKATASGTAAACLPRERALNRRADGATPARLVGGV